MNDKVRGRSPGREPGTGMVRGYFHALLLTFRLGLYTAQFTGSPRASLPLSSTGVGLNLPGELHSSRYRNILCLSGPHQAQQGSPGNLLLLALSPKTKLDTAIECGTSTSLCCLRHSHCDLAYTRGEGEGYVDTRELSPLPSAPSAALALAFASEGRQQSSTLRPQTITAETDTDRWAGSPR